MTLISDRRPAPTPPDLREIPSSHPAPDTTMLWTLSTAAIIGLLLMSTFGGFAYGAVIALLAAVLFSVAYGRGTSALRTSILHGRVDRRDLFTILWIYAVVIAFYRVAFVIVDDNDALLFVSFAAGLLVGVIAPIVYTVWIRGRSLCSLGLSLTDLPHVASLALTFAALQFAITLWGYDLPQAREWVPLLGMALMVGLFEAIFFRGFVQGRLQAAFGTAPAVFGAALLYGLYHVGYGMGLDEIVFLSGLGIVYALVYATASNILILWPLLTPLGNLFAQLESGELAGRLPWTSLLGFADVMVVMAAVIWFAHRKERKDGATRSVQALEMPITSS